jgi:ABC-type amino acid transport substrate-binding protein
MARDESGNPVGKDYSLTKKIAKELGQLPEISVPDLRVVEVAYPNVDSLLLSGLRHGEVDIGVGEITRTRQRERRGILFTRSYVSTPIVLLGNEGMRRGLYENDRLGVLRGTTYARAAESISLKRHITIIEDDSLGHLLRRLDRGDVHFILLDRTVAQPWHESEDYKIVEPEESLLADYYKKEYADEYAIATKDKTLCRLINSVMDKGEVAQYIADNYPRVTSKAANPCIKVD